MIRRHAPASAKTRTWGTHCVTVILGDGQDRYERKQKDGLKLRAQSTGHRAQEPKRFLRYTLRAPMGTTNHFSAVVRSPGPDKDRNQGEQKDEGDESLGDDAVEAPDFEDVGFDVTEVHGEGEGWDR
jgi:hypothetical protein